MNFVRSIRLVGLIKVASKISALFRDRVIAQLLGAGPLADMFFAAFNAANSLKNVAGEEPVKAVFIPVFAEYYEQMDEQKRWEMVNTVLNTFLLGLGIVAFAAVLLSPLVARTITPGMTATEHADVLTPVLRIMFTTVLFGGGAVFLFCMLTTIGSFGIPAALPLILNICIISGTILFFRKMGLVAVAGGVVVGTLAQFLVQLPPLYRRGYRYRFVLDWQHPALYRIVRLMIPVLITAGLVQLTILIDAGFASTLGPGNISFLYYGNRIMLFPYDVVGLTISMVAFPVFAREVAVRDTVHLAHSFNLALRLLVVLSLPAMAGIILLARPVVTMVFGGASFNGTAVDGASSALIWYMTGLIGYAGIRIGYPLFYSFGDTKTPLVLGGLCLGMNILFDFIFMQVMGGAGLALASSLVACINLGILLVLIRKKLFAINWKVLGISAAQSLITTLVMVAAISAFYKMAQTGTGTLVALSGSISLGVICYMSIMKLIKNREVERLMNIFSRE